GRRGGVAVRRLCYRKQRAPFAAAPPAPVAPEPVADGGGRAKRRQRVPTRDIFCELADLAAIPRTAYALEMETDGALCLVPAPDGYEVFMAMDGARHEARSFPDEEAAYFYLFGVLAAEAVRNGGPPPPAAPAGARRPPGRTLARRCPRSPARLPGALEDLGARAGPFRLS